jgi:protein-disulfide isomerase
MLKHSIVAAALLMTGAAEAQTAPPLVVIATIDGKPVFETDLATAQDQLLALKRQEYEIRKTALDALIDQKLIEAEAARRGISPTVLYGREVAARAKEPTDGEIDSFWLAQRDRIARPLAEVKPQMKLALKLARLNELRLNFVATLRRKAKIAILLEAPRVEVASDPARLKGPADAPVRIVEFSDYECPFCRSEEPVVKEVLAKYGDRVSLAYRDFPLTQIHPRAQLAAEASRCAAAEGKFWEYHDRLFTQPAKLEPADLTEHARLAGLDLAKFSACLDGRKQQDAVGKDADEGHDAGVDGTPAFFINGIYFNGAQPASVFEKIIDDELARKHA